MLDTSKYAYFILLPEYRRRAANSFRGYSDEEGQIVEYYEGKRDKHSGELIPTYFTYKKGKHHMHIRVTDKDINGLKKVDFLRNHPLCEGSKLQKEGNYTPLFREMNTEKDAQVAIDFKIVRNQAENAVLGLNLEELKSAAALVGEFSPKETVQRHRVLEVAGATPKEFLEMINAPEFKVRALIRRGVRNGTLSKQGTIIKWKEVLLGGDEQAALSQLINNEDMYEAVKKEVDNLS
jgi:hypothetical protein